MKKKTLLVLAVCMGLAATATAQELRYGIIGGYNLNSSVANFSKSGFHAGVRGEYSFSDASKGLYTDFGLILSSKGWKSTWYYDQTKSMQWECTPYYLNIPVHLGYKFRVNDNLSIFADAGPYFNFGVFGKMKQISIPSGGKETVTTTSKNVFKDNLVEIFDYGAGFRAGVEVVRHLQVGIGYDWAFKSPYKDISNTKHRTLVVSCSYLF